jgi:hypothetical protein
MAEILGPNDPTNDAIRNGFYANNKKYESTKNTTKRANSKKRTQAVGTKPKTKK